MLRYRLVRHYWSRPTEAYQMLQLGGISSSMAEKLLEGKEIRLSVSDVAMARNYGFELRSEKEHDNG